MTIGRQVNFHMHPDDLAEFGQALRERGGVSFVEEELPTRQVNTVDTLTIPDMGTWRRFYLARDNDLPNIVLDAVPEQNYWRVNVDRSPVIEFNRGLLDGKSIRRGRLYYQPGFWSSYENDACWVEKSKEFISWADGILRWIRRHYKMEPVPRFYAGHHALAWLNEEDGRTLET